jgi:hypothetical protein
MGFILTLGILSPGGYILSLHFWACILSVRLFEVLVFCGGWRYRRGTPWGTPLLSCTTLLIY